MTTKIIGTGSYLPEYVVTNDDLAKLVDTSDEWIASRTGIRNRRIATNESGVDMAAAAAEEALKDAGMDGSEIDLILVATCSSDFQFPSTACLVQKAIHATNAAAFDLSAACSGFLFALHTAHAYICAGIYKNILLVGVEVLSKLIDWNDRSTCVLFGDGAGAAVVTAAPQTELPKSTLPLFVATNIWAIRLDWRLRHTMKGRAKPMEYLWKRITKHRRCRGLRMP